MGTKKRLDNLEKDIQPPGGLYITIQDFNQPDLFFMAGERLTLEAIRERLKPGRDTQLYIIHTC